MKQQARELLVTTKVAQQWHEDFDNKVDELMGLVEKIDTEQQVQDACELIDVYHKTNTKPADAEKKQTLNSYDKPFAFLVFRN